MFIKRWPLIISVTYLSIGLYPFPIFSSPHTSSIYNWSAITVGILCVLSGIFWRQSWLRNMMGSLAVARTISVLLLVGLEQPPLSFPSIMRLIAAGFIGVWVLLLVVVEIPYLKAIRDGHK